MHVFIVNDEPVAQTALASILAGRREVEGFDTAKDATEAFDKLMRRNFDVLLLDIRTPEVFGIELLDQLTAHDRLLPTVVFVTSYQQQALAALKKHPVDYILKPFSNERSKRRSISRFADPKKSALSGWRRLFRKHSLGKSVKRSRLRPTAKSCSLRPMMCWPSMPRATTFCSKPMPAPTFCVFRFLPSPRS